MPGSCGKHWSGAGTMCRLRSTPRSSRTFPTQPSVAEIDLDGHADFMSKEIFEQQAVVNRLVARLLPGLDGELWDGLGLAEPARVRFVACGSSLNASAAMARVFRRVAGVP